MVELLRTLVRQMKMILEKSAGNEAVPCGTDCDKIEVVAEDNRADAGQDKDHQDEEASGKPEDAGPVAAAVDKPDDGLDTREPSDSSQLQSYKILAIRYVAVENVEPNEEFLKEYYSSCYQDTSCLKQSNWKRKLK